MDTSQPTSSLSSDTSSSHTQSFASAFGQLTLSVDEDSTHTNVFTFCVKEDEEEKELTSGIQKEQKGEKQKEETLSDSSFIPSQTYTRTEFPPLPPPTPIPRIFYSKPTTTCLTSPSSSNVTYANSTKTHTHNTSSLHVHSISPFNTEYHAYADTDENQMPDADQQNTASPTATQYLSQLLASSRQETYTPKYNENPLPKNETFSHPLLEAYLLKRYTYYTGWPSALPYKWEFQRLISVTFPHLVTTHPFALHKIPEFSYDINSTLATVAELHLHISALFQTEQWKDKYYTALEGLTIIPKIYGQGLTPFLTYIEHQLTYNIHVQIAFFKNLPMNIEVLNTVALQTNFTEPISFHRNVMFFALVDPLGNSLTKVRDIFKHIDVHRFSSTFATTFIKTEFSQYLYILFLYFLFTHLSGRETLLTFEGVVSKFISDPYVQNITPNFRYVQNAILDQKPSIVYMMSVIMATVQKVYMAKHITLRKIPVPTTTI